MIAFENVSKTFRADRREMVAIHPLDLSIPAAEVFGIIGHSGAGKSTLLRMINGLETPSAGSVLVDGNDVATLDERRLRALRRRIGMIFQHFNLLSARTVAGNIAFPLQLAGIAKAQIRARVDTLLERVGLSAQRDAYPAQLSGGQKQRVGIARALATEPKVLLCDEATSALDPQTTASVLDLLSAINRDLGLTIVLITHEMDVIRRICDQVAVLDAGRLVETGPVSEVFLHPRHPTTRRFVAEAEHLDTAAQADAGRAADGRLLRLTFIGAATHAPLLAQVARDTGIDFSILSGRIDRIKHLPCGQLILAVTGADAQLAAARRQLHAAGVRIEDIAAGGGRP